MLFRSSDLVHLENKEPKNLLFILTDVHLMHLKNEYTLREIAREEYCPCEYVRVYLDPVLVQQDQR